MSKNNMIINGIDVSEYFIDVVDEGGSTIDYKILPNSERLLVEKIFEQNQQLKRLQEENEELKELIGKTRYNRLEMYESFETECNKYKQALEEVRDIAEYSIMHNGELNSNYQIILQNINEVLNDRD